METWTESPKNEKTTLIYFFFFYYYMFAKGIKKPLFLSLIILVSLISFHFFIFSSWILLAFGVSFLLFTLFFFRDPKRKVSEGIVSPADGKIVSIDHDENTIEIFMNVWDVHVNRAPVSGKIEKTEHLEGKHSPAFTEKAEQNEKQLFQLSLDENRKVKVWQIAGVFARRIVPYVQLEDRVEKGERIGMIKFGSKVRMKFSQAVDFTVEKEQKVKAGSTKLGDWHG